MFSSCDFRFRARIPVNKFAVKRGVFGKPSTLSKNVFRTVMLAAFEKFCLICFRFKAEKGTEFTRVRHVHRKNLHHKLVSFDFL